MDHRENVVYDKSSQYTTIYFRINCCVSTGLIVILIVKKHNGDELSYN
jgi:hypothetical protein